MAVILEQFIHSLASSGLMTDEEIRAFLDGLPDEKRPSSAAELAKLLFQRKKLTKFQAQAIYQGKTKGLVVGNYVVLDKIGQGGMGHVYKARHKRMKRIVALKVLPSAVTKSPEAVQRFQREVEAAAKLSHPNIVTAHDADEADGVHFLVMEHVEGNDLARTVRQRGTLSLGKALDYIIQAAKGLEYAHAMGVIHRDIKPSNLLVDSGGTVKLLDMGLARVEQEVGSDTTELPSLTYSGQVMGTVDYMAPEQSIDTHKADQRADIYSLGCTLCYLITGRPVYEGDTLAKKILAHREEPIPSLDELRPDIPTVLNGVFQKMVAKNPDQRHASMSEVLGELERCRTELEESVEETVTYAGQAAAEIETSNASQEITVAQGDADSALDRWLHEELPEGPTHFITKPRKPLKLTQWLSQKENGEFVLPSEAQWEYACRAGTTTFWHCGDSEKTLEEYAWFKEKTPAPLPVGQLKPNGWGLYDTHGNILEWCADRWSADYYAQSPPKDPTGPPTGSERVHRGGLARDEAANLRSARRSHRPPSYRHGCLGFRVASVLADRPQ